MPHNIGRVREVANQAWRPVAANTLLYDVAASLSQLAGHSKINSQSTSFTNGWSLIPPQLNSSTAVGLNRRLDPSG